MVICLASCNKSDGQSWWGERMLLVCLSVRLCFSLTHGLEVLFVVVAIVGKPEGVDVVPLPRGQAALAFALALRAPLLLRAAIS